MKIVATGLSLKLSATINSVRHNFLIDTGSSLSIIPYNSNLHNSLRPTGISLTNASGAAVACYGELDAPLCIPALRRTFNWSFLIADVTQPILGTDFLSSCSLLVDCKNKILIDSETNLKIELLDGDENVVLHHIDYDGIDSRARELLQKYPILTTPLQFCKTVPTDCQTEHIIDTEDNAPVHSKSRPLTGTKLKAAQDEFKFLLDAGRIRRSNSAWSSPLHLVPKKEVGQYRPCGDYRNLNSITKSDKYPIPHMRSLIMSMHGMRFFSKIDLVRAYLQIPLAPADIPKTAVTTPFGLYEFLYVPYGLKNAGSTFQRHMDKLFANIPRTFVYIDDILIASETEEQHAADIDKVLSVLAEHNLRVTLKKCEFFQSSLTFLGHEISADGIKPPSDRVSAIQDFKPPRTSTELRRYMGTLNFFRQMVPNFAQKAYPLTELLRMHPKSKELPWDDEAQSSFDTLKHELANCPTLAFPSPETSDLQLVSDCSDNAAGAALYQMVDNVPHPISFFSYKLSQPQRSYSTYDRELLALYKSILHFKTLIDGHNVTVFTDHKPLVSAFNSKSIPKSDRQQRQLSLISEYISSIHHIKGKDNIVADCLSRPIYATYVDSFDLPGLASAQVNDEELESLKDRLKIFQVTPDLKLYCDMSTPVPRPYVPLSQRHEIISFLHSLSHPGVKTTIKLVKQRYYFPFIDKMVKEYINNCTDCQRSKINVHTKSPIETISAPTDRFNTVHIDLITLPPVYSPSIPSSVPFRYVLTCIDRATRWTECIPLTDITASNVAIAFVSGWISRFGVPLNVVSDRGSQFLSEFFQQISQIMGFNHLRTTSYHPQSNGFIERLHRTLKSALMARNSNWYLSLPVVLLGIRMSPNSLNYSPFTAVTGAYMLCPHPLITNENTLETNDETLNQFVNEMHSINFYDFASGTSHNKSHAYVPNDLYTVPQVWLRVDRVRRSLEAPYSGPYDVIKRFPKYFIVKLPQGETSVSIDRLKPARVPLPTKTVTEPIIDQQTLPHSTTDQPTILPNPSPPVDVLPQPPTEPNNAPVKTRSGRTVRFNENPIYKYF